MHTTKSYNNSKMKRENAPKHSNIIHKQQQHQHRKKKEKQRRFLKGFTVLEILSNQ